MSFRKPSFDYPIVICILLLIVFGIIMLTSIGVPKSIELSKPDEAFPNCGVNGVDCYLLLKKHLVRVAIALLLFLICSKINYRFWKKISLPLFILSFLSLIAVLLIGTTNNTFAKSWFNLYYASIQPSEFAKLALILYFATWLEKKTEEIKSFNYGFIPFCILSSVMIVPLLLQPDLGSTLVFVFICIMIYFTAGARIRDILFGSFVALSIALVIVLNVDYIHDRFNYFLKNEENCKETYCWQSLQANIAVGSGGLWGRGLTQGIQKSYWLPQAVDDFIFAASAEEVGFFGSILWLFLYVVIMYRTFHIAVFAPNRFAMMTAAGIGVWLGIQTFLNISVNISLLPITGVTLPFMSYGGSSLVSMMIAMGILINISKHITVYAHSFDRRGNRRSYIPKYSYSRRSL